MGETRCWERSSGTNKNCNYKMIREVIIFLSSLMLTSAVTFPIQYNNGPILQAAYQPQVSYLRPVPLTYVPQLSVYHAPEDIITEDGLKIEVLTTSVRCQR